jgi:plastocyanin
MFIFNKQTILIVLVISLSGLFAACQSTPTLVSPSAPGISVGILGDECPSVEVKAGEQVTWTNQDVSTHVVRHIPDDGNSQFDSGILNMGDSFSFTFVQPGVYTYQCLIEYEATGTVTVKP